jgi:hypothetical protein
MIRPAVFLIVCTAHSPGLKLSEFCSKSAFICRYVSVQVWVCSAFGWEHCLVSYVEDWSYSSITLSIATDYWQIFKAAVQEIWEQGVEEMAWSWGKSNRQIYGGTGVYENLHVVKRNQMLYKALKSMIVMQAKYIVSVKSSDILTRRIFWVG